MDLGIGDRTAVGTGGTGRIGRTDCKTLASEGANVGILDVDADGAGLVADEIPRRVTVVRRWPSSATAPTARTSPPRWKRFARSSAASIVS